MNKQCVCGETIAKSENGTTKIRSKILLVRSAGVAAVCKGCGMEVALDLPALQKALCESPVLATPLGPPLILAK